MRPMTLSERMVWANIFAEEYEKDEKGRKIGRKVDRLLTYAQKAADVVLDMRHAAQVTLVEDSKGRIDPIAIQFLRQVTDYGDH